MLTGVRSSLISGNLCDIPTDRISEFEAIGCGGLYVLNLQEALVVSMGTGAAFVMADYNQRVHIGGSGLGGGTLCGLGKLSSDFTSNDIALGLINMVLHNIGKLAIFAIQNIFFLKKHSFFCLN